MREGYSGFTLSAKDREIMELMVSLGVSKNVAKVVLFLTKSGEAPSRHIEDAVDLRQSEVSIVIKRLRDKGWISSKNLKKPGKGRPTQLYKMRFSFRRIVKEIEGDTLKDIEGMKKKVATLKRLAK
jgi:predicted transcriptional regulator